MPSKSPHPEAPIGIFDSGLGGLTVFREIASALPGEDLIYFGDSARVPYGIKSPETVKRYSLEIAGFLMQHQVKAMVVACNTASAVAIEALEGQFAIPILGVIQPGAAAAAQATRSGKVALIGTEATVRSQAYERALREIKASLEIKVQACPLFVPLVEEGWTEHPVTEEVARIYLKDLQQQAVDTLILGCTHYPLLKPLLSRVLGASVNLVDSAQASASALKDLLKKEGLLSKQSSSGQQTFYCSDAPEKMRSLGSLFLGRPLDGVKQVVLD